MKLNYVKIEQILDGLKDLIKIDLKVKTAFKIRKIIKKLNSEYDTFIEQRNEIIKKFELEDGSIKNEEDKHKALEMISEIAFEKIEFEIEKLTEEELDCDHITTEILMKIDDILE